MNLNQYSGVSPELRALLSILNFTLPFIRGKWFVVDPYYSTTTMEGLAVGQVVADLKTAYNLCRSGAGDGIVVLSGGTSVAHTTSYLSSPLEFSKHGITILGVASPTGIFGRARVANVKRTRTATTFSFPSTSTIADSAGGFLTAGFAVGDIIRTDDTGNFNDTTGAVISAVTASLITVSTTPFTIKTAAQSGSTAISTYCPYLIHVSGDNNIFQNINIWNGGNDALEIGGLKITGKRNTFINCHVTGGAGVTATVNERSVELGDGAEENIFILGTIGTDSIDRGNNANCELLINGTVSGTARNKFVGVEFLSMANGGTAHVAIKSASATSMGRHMLFEDCSFVCYKTNLGTDQASVFGGTGFNTAKIYFIGKSVMCGYALWDAATANDCCFSCMPQSHAAGGLAIVAS